MSRMTKYIEINEKRINKKKKNRRIFLFIMSSTVFISVAIVTFSAMDMFGKEYYNRFINVEKVSYINDNIKTFYDDLLIEINNIKNSLGY